MRGLNGTTSYAKRTGFSSAMAGRIGTDTSIHAATRAAKLATMRAKKNVEKAKKLEDAFKEEQAKAEELARKLQLRKERILKRELRKRVMHRAANTIQQFFVEVREREDQECASTALQAVWRAHAAKTLHQDKKHAAAVIAGATRQYQARKRRREEKARREKAAQEAREALARRIAAQKAAAEALERARAAEAAAREELRRRNERAATIQREFRKQRQRKREEGAKVIQNLWRQRTSEVLPPQQALAVDTGPRHRVGPRRAPRSGANGMLSQVSDLGLFWIVGLRTAKSF